MAKLIHSTTKWFGSQTQTDKKATYSLSTSGQYVDKNIELQVNVNGINLKPSEDFFVNDGINTWTWNVDSNGNVLIY